MSLALPPEDRRILLASIMELQECANQQYQNYGASELFFQMCELLDERLGRLNEDS